MMSGTINALYEYCFNILKCFFLNYIIKYCKSVFFTIIMFINHQFLSLSFSYHVVISRAKSNPTSLYCSVVIDASVNHKFVCHYQL